MSNIVINDLEHNIELDRKSLIELKGGNRGYTQDIFSNSNDSYFTLLAYGRGSFKRGRGQQRELSLWREGVYIFDEIY